MLTGLIGDVGDGSENLEIIELPSAGAVVITDDVCGDSDKHEVVALELLGAIDVLMACGVRCGLSLSVLSDPPAPADCILSSLSATSARSDTILLEHRISLLRCSSSLRENRLEPNVGSERRIGRP